MISDLGKKRVYKKQKDMYMCKYNKKGGKRMKIEKRGIILQFDENTLTYSMECDHQTWKWPKNYVPRMICEEGEFCFRDACQISHEVIHFGTGEGIHSRFKGFKKDGEEIPVSF